MKKLFPIYSVILSVVIMLAFAGSQTVTVISENMPLIRNRTIILDAGHGGVDGGTTSITGVLESGINLQIAQRLNDLLHLLGVETVMIRNDDRSIHTEGTTIAQYKVSDLKNRVKIVNETPGAFLVSIHQNYYPDGRYSGAQVFYCDVNGSAEFAKSLQTAFNLNTSGDRKAKKASGVYIMDHIQQPGVLIECGFLSNPQEEFLLRSEDYQKKLCCVIASEISCNISCNTLS